VCKGKQAYAVAATCPAESSFRAHLTELAFRRHLAHIRSSDEPEEGARATNGHAPSGTNSGADTPIAPFRFANHVAITLRTPSLCYRSLFFFALAFAAAPSPPVYLSDPVIGKPPKASGAPKPEPTVAYVGVLGHWFMLGYVPELLQSAWRGMRIGRRDKARKKSAALDRPGVMDMRAVAPKDESPGPGSRPSGLVPKLLFKTDSHKDLSELLPMHSTPSSIPSVGPGSRRGSVSTLAPPPIPPQQPDPSIEISSPVLTALKADLAAAQAVLTELQAQLSAHDESVAAAQAHLQSTVDELRQRRKDDDAERQDLKTKTKTLEDQKRQAESSRRDADKRLKSAEAVRDGLQGKIAAALGEIEDLKGKMVASEQQVKIVNDEGAQHVVDTRAAVEKKTEELGDLETQISQLDTAIDSLSKQVTDAEDRLKTAETAADEARKIAPEEEMMLMAAAYEAAASESYLHGQRQNQADNRWASQAAAYMAEAGFPHLDESYTARPTANSTAGGYGHLSRAHPHNASYRSLNDKRVADVAGFEDFGPGASRSLVPQRHSTPPIQVPMDDASEHGSPSTQSASFPNSWLPQGLVRSLEGGDTPLDGGASETEGDDSLFASLEDALAAGPSDEGSPNYDSDQDSPVGWPSSAPASGERKVTPTSRFNSTPPAMGGSAATLPGMGSLPSSSRRWFSSSPSSENVSSFPLFNAGLGSSDSLPGVFDAFAPSAKEKMALKWPLLGKSRWTGGQRSISALDEVTANLKHDPGPIGSGSRRSPPPSAGPTGAFNPGPHVQEIFNRAPGAEWPAFANGSSHSPHASPEFTTTLDRPGFLGYGAAPKGKGREVEGEHDEDEHHRVPERKQSFRFFSLARKGAA
jgi:predicted  nucleic acid-binding Zn-ribbon protein